MAPPWWWSVIDPLPDADAVRLRPATPADADDAGPLVFAAAPILFALLFGPREVDAVRALTRLFALGTNPFGFDHATVAVRDGKVVGVMVASSVEARHKAGRRMWHLLPRVRGPIAMLRRLPEALAMVRGYMSPPPEAYYVGILSVADGFQGRGIGTTLLQEAALDAARAGCPTLVLHVETDHRDALRFYKRAGYTEVRRYAAAARLARRGVAGFVTMQRAVPPLPVP